MEQIRDGAPGDVFGYDLNDQLDAGKRHLGAWGAREADCGKARLGRDLRSQTTMSLKWIARRLEMDHGRTSPIFFANKVVRLCQE